MSVQQFFGIVLAVIAGVFVVNVVSNVTGFRMGAGS